MTSRSSSPFFSVLIPSYNRPEYLPLAVASVLANTGIDFELIISDDCSPRQAEIITSLSTLLRDPRVIFVPQTINLGEAKNRHFLMQKARGIYRLILGDDDLLAATALKTLHETIERQPGFDLYLFGYSVIDEDGRIFETRHAMKPIELSLAHPKILKDLFHSDIFPFWFYHPATFCFPATLHNEIVPNHSIGIGDDLIFIFDAMLAGKKALVISDILFSYRKFMGPRTYSQTNLSRTQLADITTRRHILYDLMSRGGTTAPLSEFLRSRNFRERFLYNRLVIDTNATEATIHELQLSPDHLAEALAYWRTRRKSWFRHWLQLQRTARFSGYFGISGLVESVNVFLQRRSYRRTLSRL